MPGSGESSESSRRGWRPPAEVTPTEVRPTRFVLVVTLIFVVLITVVLLQPDDSGGFLTAVFVAIGVVLFLIGVRSVVARVRLESDAIVHTDLFGKRRLALSELDRPLVLEPQRRQRGRPTGARGYELVIRQAGARRPWLFATGMFWDRAGLRRLGSALDAARTSAHSRSALEETHPGTTTWALRRTSTQWSILFGAALMIGLVLWQTR